MNNIKIQVNRKVIFAFAESMVDNVSKIKIEMLCNQMIPHWRRLAQKLTGN